jgi:hypothetical protein
MVRKKLVLYISTYAYFGDIWLLCYRNVVGVAEIDICSCCGLNGGWDIYGS